MRAFNINFNGGDMPNTCVEPVGWPEPDLYPSRQNKNKLAAIDVIWMAEAVNERIRNYGGSTLQYVVGGTSQDVLTMSDDLLVSTLPTTLTKSISSSQINSITGPFVSARNRNDPYAYRYGRSRFIDTDDIGNYTFLNVQTAKDAYDSLVAPHFLSPLQTPWNQIAAGDRYDDSVIGSIIHEMNESRYIYRSFGRSFSVASTARHYVDESIIGSSTYRNHSGGLAGFHLNLRKFPGQDSGWSGFSLPDVSVVEDQKIVSARSLNMDYRINLYAILSFYAKVSDYYYKPSGDMDHSDVWSKTIFGVVRHPYLGISRTVGMNFTTYNFYSYTETDIKDLMSNAASVLGIDLSPAGSVASQHADLDRHLVVNVEDVFMVGRCSGNTLYN